MSAERRRRASRPPCACRSGRWRGDSSPAPRRVLSLAVAACLLSGARLSVVAEVRSVSRVYHSACLERGQSYWDYENFQLSSVGWEDVDRYEVTGRLGFGRFSEVMEGVRMDDGRRVVLKVLKPARSYKIKREIRVLQLLAGGPNILALEGACRNQNTGITTLILEHLGDGVQWFAHPSSSNNNIAGGATPGLRLLEASPRRDQPPASPTGAAASSIGLSRRLSPTTVANASGSASHDNRNVRDNGEGGRVGDEAAWREHSADGRDQGRAAGGGVADGRHRERFVEKKSGVVGRVGGGVGPAARLSDYEVRLYLYKLLQALDFAHSRGLMHRDVKPRNIVVNRRTRALRLIDWGLGDFYIPGRRNMARVGSRYYKAPELLVGFRFYDYAVDIFSVGCMLAGFLLNREPFFRGKDNEDQLVRIALVLGTQGLHDFLRKYDITLEPRLLEMLGTHRKKAWASLGGGGGGGSGGDEEGKGECRQEGLDLLDRMLCYDHQDRISAGEALSHAFFDPVREEAEACTRNVCDAA